MKRAIQLPQYSDVKPFSPPEGVTTARIDKTSNLLVDSSCPNNSIYAAFLDGTAPVNTCSQMGENPQNFIQKIFGVGGSKPAPPNATTPPPPSTTSAPVVRTAPTTPPDGNAPDTTQQPAPPKKKNFLQKIFGGGKDKEKDKEAQPQPNPPPQ